MQDKITKEKFYPHKIEDVWRAISSAEEISAWFLKADFKAEPGYNYTLTHETIKEDGDCTTMVVRGTILKAEPVHHLVYTWIVDDVTETTVSWTLQEKEGGTLIILEHHGISHYPSKELATNMFNSFSGGWERCLNDLEKHMKSQIHV
jgi:uncharacterized protein YndB with AHSA1/START domain